MAGLKRNIYKLFTIVISHPFLWLLYNAVVGIREIRYYINLIIHRCQNMKGEEKLGDVFFLTTRVFLRVFLMSSLTVIFKYFKYWQT